MVNYILCNKKLCNETYSPARCPHGPMNVFQCFAVCEEVRCFHQQIGEEAEEKLYEHDGWFEIIVPAGYGRE